MIKMTKYAQHSKYAVYALKIWTKIKEKLIILFLNLRYRVFLIQDIFSSQIILVIKLIETLSK